ncbi:capsular polysaccharide synthesis protein [Rhizobium glycinendophyticum]|uniref:Mannosyltransferase n=1 Tax=Rhizobium glycinendophyticum TaxID=2589807 RepID=A0A504V1S9_9HYPH|nr:capsular polysaccharide synthesis protein [Rhizobium glycinendophyticum]TPP11382.1 mannosyltransferase [Rhizobium glycinendophyticum]
MRRSIKGKQALKAENYNPRYDTISKKLPKIIWVYWHVELAEAPEVAKLGMRSWQIMNPGWSVNFVTESNLRSFIEPPVSPLPRKVQWRADVIRLALLARYGGVWVDMTSFCVKPLDHWLPTMMESGFFAFPDLYPSRLVNNAFLAAVPGEYLTNKWSRLMYRYFSKPGKLLHYFWCMHLFEFIVLTDRRARGIWRRTPKLRSRGAMLLKRMIGERDLYSPIPQDIDLSSVLWQKLSSRLDERALLAIREISATGEVDLLRLENLTDPENVPVQVVGQP